MAKEYQFLPQKDQSTVNTATIYHSHTTFPWRASGDIPSAQQSTVSTQSSEFFRDKDPTFENPSRSELQAQQHLWV